MTDPSRLNTVTIDRQPDKITIKHGSLGRAVVVNRDITTGRITGVADPYGVEITYGYDAAGNLSTVTDRANNTTTFRYDPPVELAHLNSGLSDHFLWEILDGENERIFYNE